MTTKQDSSTEQAIMEAAEELFLDKGYNAVSTVDIAKKAGCNQSLVHYYYRSKKNLFGLVFKKKAEYFISYLMRISETDLSFEEKMTNRIEGHFNFIRSNWKLPVLFFNEIATNKELIEEILQSFSNLPFPAFIQLQGELNEEFEKGNIRKTDAFNLILNVFSLNVMTFMMLPLIKMVSKLPEQEIEIMLEIRKNENVRTILSSLKP